METEKKVQSTVNKAYEVSTTLWAISVLNTGSLLTGHSVIVVEGLKEDDSFFPKRFIGHYDIKAKPFEGQSSLGNTKGFISKVTIEENEKVTFEGKEDYYRFHSKTYYRSPLEAKAMIESIKKDKQLVAPYKEKRDTEKANAPKNITNLALEEYLQSKIGEPPLKYQLVGKNSLLADDGAGDNCAGWVLEKLAIANIGDGSGKPKPAITVGCTVS